MIHLVLGSSGQIGYHVVDYFKKLGETVIEFDIQRSYKEDLRIQNNKLLEDKIIECDIVHFLAFDIGGAKYLEKYQDTYQFIDNNMRIMINTFELIKKHNKPFIFASSQMSELIYSSYGVLKNIGERITKDLGGFVVRLWNVYGYEPEGEKSHVVTDFIKMAKYKGVINMRTDGSESRQLLYGDDCAEALLVISKRYNELDKKKNYHITNFNWVKIIDVAKIIQGLTNCEIVTADRKDETQKNAMNDPDNLILNIWQPKTDLVEGITKIYNLI